MSQMKSIRQRLLHLACFAFVLLGFFGRSSSASAQECKRPPACRAEDLDASGCCPHAAPPVSHNTSAPADSHCTGGKESTADTGGHCCWAGQVWSRGHCVGVPTGCPSNLTLNVSGQSCDLAACEKGEVRADNGINCCWPGQGWSATRGVCVGIPRCPKLMEVEGGDHCVSVDKDGDGIPNAKDQCPDQPEDFNHYKDEDGCPDEPERLAMVAAQERTARIAAEAAASAAAARAAAEQKAAQEKAALEAAERQRVQALHDRQAAADAEAAEAHKAWEENRHTRTVRRTTGLVFTGVGVASIATSAIFAALGGGENSSISKGGFAHASDISSAASAGQTDNSVAEGTLVVGLVTLAVGVPLTFASLPTAEPGPAPRVSVTVVPTPGGMVLLGRF